MARESRVCQTCGRVFEPKGRRGPLPTYCSRRCKDAARYATHRASTLAAIEAAVQEGTAEPYEPSPVVRSVTDRDIVGAVMQARGAQAVFDAGGRCGPPTLRPMCDRIAEGIGRALGREGLL